MTRRPESEIATLELGGRRSRIVEAPLARLADDQPALIVADTNTASLLPDSLTAERCIVAAGEACKSWEVLRTVVEAMVAHGITRDGHIAAVGGGAVTDLGALAASLYLRGIGVTLVPTSLLAMVDAAIGGKTAIDVGGRKNTVGTFYAADTVIIDPQLLETLSDREYRSGLAEVIKAALLGDASLVDLLEGHRDEVLARSPDLVRRLVRRAASVKVDIVQADFREAGRRAELNLGHTFGHALEAVAGLGVWTHGEAVAWGISRAMHAGVALGVTDRGWARRVVALLAAYGFSVGAAPLPPAEIIEAMSADKKRRIDGLRFVLQRNAQNTVLVPMETGQLADILNDEGLTGGHS